MPSTGITYVDYQQPAVLDGVNYDILSVEMSDEFVDDENYYTDRGTLEKEIAFWTNPTKSVVIYQQELSYVKVNLELTNTTTQDVLYEQTDFRIYNIKNRKTKEFFDFFDYRAWDLDGNETEWDFVLEAGKTVRLEFVYVTFLPSSYELYLGMPKAARNQKSYLYLSLNQIQTEKRERDLAKLKTYGSTNYDLAMASTGSDVMEKYFFEADETVGRYINVVETGEIYDSKQYTIVEVALEDSYENLPETFRQRDYISEMTKVYKERYGFTEEQLQYLVLTVRLEQLQNVEEFWTVTTSQIMWLYNRKETGKIFPIGYPDDYEVSDSETEGYEHLDTYPDQTNDVHYVRAVYVIWPEALEDVYLWTSEGCVVEGYENSYSAYASEKGGADREIGGGIHVPLS